MRKLRLVACNVNSEAVEDDVVFYSPTASFDVPDHHYHRPRRSFHRAPLTASLAFVSHRRSFCYDRLQQLPIRLTVVKLDGSTFDIEVQKSARIAELKQAVERAFDHLMSHGPEEISWQHVWRHFCMSYGDQKLVNDEEFIRDYGMREGDELHFVHHIAAMKRLSRKQTGNQADIQKVHRLCDQPETIHEVEEIEEVESDYYHDEDDVSTSSKESMATNSSLLRRLLLHSRPVSSEKGRCKDGARTSKMSTGFIGCFKSMFHLQGNRNASALRIPSIET